MSFRFIDPWHLFFPREGGHVVGFSGSGGKTGLMRACAEALNAEDVPLILTCTTRSEVLPGLEPVPAADLESLRNRDLPPVCFLHGGIDNEGKWQGLGPAMVDALPELFPDRVILVETDGAAKKSLKFYRDGEPVWPERTSLAVVVMGIGEVGLKASEVVHRFDADRLAGAENLHPDKPWLWDHQLALLQGPGGYLAQVPEQVPAVLALGGLAAQEDSIGLFDFVGRAMDDSRIPLVTFFETTGEAPSFRTACLDEEDDGV